MDLDEQIFAPPKKVLEKRAETEEREKRVLDIFVAPNSKLKRVADPVTEVTYVEQDLIDDMFETMEASDGAGLAANQLGENKRIIVMDIMPLSSEEQLDTDIHHAGRYAMINPEIIDRQGSRWWSEGCLSVPGFHERIERAGYVDVTGMDRYGNPLRLRASGLLAACIQHEVDHLNGKLFIDHLSRLKRDIIVRKLKKFRKKGTMIVRMPVGPKF